MDTPNLRKKLEDYKTKIKFDFQSYSDFSFDKILNSKKIYIVLPIAILVLTLLINPHFLKKKTFEENKNVHKFSFANIFLFSLVTSLLFFVALFAYKYKKN
jgi:hypothetical protein